MFSIICAYNNKKILDDLLLKSLNEQVGAEYEIILINAQKHGFQSASETLNYGCSKAKGDFLIVCHQDIVFQRQDILAQISHFCQEYDFGAAGVAGLTRIKGNQVVASKITEGPNRALAGNFHNFTTPLESMSLDECLFIIPKDVYQQHRFNDLGKTWHLYASDLACACLRDHLKVMTFPIDGIYHASNGKSFNMNYFEALINLAKLYKKDFKTIYTIYGKWSTNSLVLRMKIFYRKLRYKILEK